MKKLFMLWIILFNCHIFASEPAPEPLISCVYSDKTEGNTMTPHEDCGKLNSDGLLELSKEHMKRIAFDDDKLTCIYVHGAQKRLQQVQYLHTSGKTVRPLFFDNGCDYFREGLARMIQNDQLGYFNKQLEIVIQTNFEFGLPFSNGYAIVCHDIKEHDEMEHITYTSEKCGMINRDGNIVLQPIYRSDDWKVFDNFREKNQ